MHDTTRSQRDKLGCLLEFQSYEPGATIFSEGDESDGLYILVNGEAVAEGAAPAGDERMMLSTMPSGSIMGEIALITGGKVRVFVKTNQTLQPHQPTTPTKPRHPALAAHGDMPDDDALPGALSARIRVQAKFPAHRAGAPHHIQVPLTMTLLQQF